MSPQHVVLKRLRASASVYGHCQTCKLEFQVKGLVSRV